MPNLIYLNRLGYVPNAFQTISSRKIIFRFFRFPPPPPPPPQKKKNDSPRVPHCRKLYQIRKKSERKLDFRCRATKSDFRFLIYTLKT